MQRNLTPLQLARRNLIATDTLLDHKGQLTKNEMIAYIDQFIKKTSDPALKYNYDYKDAESTYQRIRTIPELTTVIKQNPVKLLMLMHTLPYLEKFYKKDNGYKYDRETVRSDILHVFTVWTWETKLEHAIYYNSRGYSGYNERFYLHDDFRPYYDTFASSIDKRVENRVYQISESMLSESHYEKSDQAGKNEFPFEAYAECTERLSGKELYQLSEGLDLISFLQLSNNERMRIISNILAFRTSNLNYFCAGNDFLDGMRSLVECNWMELSRFASLSTEEQVFISLHHTEYYLCAKHVGTELLEKLSYDKLKLVLLSLVEDESNHYSNTKRAILTFSKPGSENSERFKGEISDLLNNSDSNNITYANN